MNDNTILRIKVPAHLYESVKEQLTLNESKKTRKLKKGKSPIVENRDVKAYIDIDWHKPYEELMALAKAFNVKAENLPDEDNNEYNDPLMYRISVPLSREEDLHAFLDNMDDETYQTPENDEEQFQGNIDNIRFSQGKLPTNEAKGANSYGGWTVVKEKKMKTPPDGMKKVKEADKTEKGLVKERTLEELKMAKEALEKKIEEMESKEVK